MTVKERFLKYVKVETTSDESSESTPSTPGQLELSRILVEELKEMGIEDADLDEFGYVYASIPAKGAGSHASVGLIAHVDTSDAVKGPTDPQIVKCYDGKAITLKNGTVIDGFDFLESLKGDDLVVTSGDSVLGADDKAGVAEIMALAARMSDPAAPDHGTIHIAFTPDEEIGRGADHFNLEKFKADYAYTIDGGALGELEYECFNAASLTVDVKGINIHPGTAKNQMKNASLIAMEYASMFPAWERPEHTEGYEGFYHLTHMEGDEEAARLNYIIRDFDKDNFESRKKKANDICEFLNEKYGKDTVSVTIRDSYKNMREIIEKHPHIIKKAEEAFKACGVTPIIKPIRGGTDGALLSYKGLPCPNLSTGGYNFHGRKELIPVRAMEKMVDVMENLILNC